MRRRYCSSSLARLRSERGHSFDVSDPAPGLDIWFWLLVLAAFSIRVVNLEGTELWWDEFLVLHRASMALPDLWNSLKFQSASEVYADTSPPLHHILVHFSLLLGRSEFFAKLPSVLFGSFSVGMAYLAGRDLFGRSAGLSAGMIACLSFFHIAYSRDMRWYAIFYFFTFMALWASWRFAESLGRKSRLALATAFCGMMYTSYIAAPFIAGAYCYFLIRALYLLRGGFARKAKSFLLSCCLVAGVVAVAYLPQLTGHTVAAKLFHMQFGNYFDVAKVWLSLQQFTHGLSSVPPWHGWTLALLGIAATIRVAFFGRFSSALLVLFFCVPQVAAAFMIYVQAPVQAKYLVALLVLFFIFAGVGVQSLAEGAFWLAGKLSRGALPRLSRIAAAVAVIFALLYQAPALFTFQDGMAPTSKVVARYLALNKTNHSFIMYARNRQDKVIYNWYVGGLFRNFSSYEPGGYRRFLFVGTPGKEAAAQVPLLSVLNLRGETVQVRCGGIASMAPIPLVPPSPESALLFEQKFDTLDYYKTVWKSENIGIDSTNGTLALYGFDGLGSSLYRFTRWGGKFPEKVRLSLAVKIEKSQMLPADAKLIISVGSDESTSHQVAVLDHAALSRTLASQGIAVSATTLSGVVDLELPQAAFSGGDFFLRFSMTPGKYQSSTEISWFRLEASGPSPEMGSDPVWRLLENVYANNHVKIWNPDVELVDSNTLYVFSADGSMPRREGQAAYGSKEDLEAFQREHPGLAPVLALRYRDGSTAFFVYDATLLFGGLRLQGGETIRVRTDAALPQMVRGMSFWGKLDREQMALDGNLFTIPFVVPPQSFCVLNPGDKGLIHFAPVYDQDVLETGDFSPPTNVVKLAGQDCISCIDGKSCVAAYRIASEFPIVNARLIYYPRGNVSGNNRVKVSYSLDGDHEYKELDSYVPRGEQPWVGDMDGRQIHLAFKHPAHIIDLRFDLSGDGMQLWSSRTHPMLLEAEVDASSLMPLRLENREFQAGVRSGRKETFGVWWSPNPIDFHEKWAR
ncbi:MAG: hypothetical protein FD174_4326 [Geobacteraceae bacterium]|nr:MAG: hypothetical protein FD174_4326 [Geobacteraceae bacterium]